MFTGRVELLVAKEDALFNDLPLQMTQATSPGKEGVTEIGKLFGLKPTAVIPHRRRSSFETKVSSI